jgi:hypothetical protein
MDSYQFGSRIRNKVESWIRIRVKIQELFKRNRELWRAVDANSGGVRLKLEPYRVCRPVVAHLHHFDEEQDPDPDPHH